MKKRQRLDQLIVERGLASDLKQARGFIMTGDVLVNDRPIFKAGTSIRLDAPLRLKNNPKRERTFVSRGGVKLEGALAKFNVTVQGRIAMDMGASTGGFTDCLLRRGAQRVYAVDVGYGLLAWSLRQDERVVVLERTNIRELNSTIIPEPIELVTGDLSFISLRSIIPPVLPLLAPNANLLLLIKPQFEAPSSLVEEGGVIRDPEVRHEVISGVIKSLCDLGLVLVDGADSTLPGPSGNVEYIAWFRWPASS